MRILCLAVLLNTLPQLLKKFDAEVRRLRAPGDVEREHADILRAQDVRQLHRAAQLVQVRRERLLHADLADGRADRPDLQVRAVQAFAHLARLFGADVGDVLAVHAADLQSVQAVAAHRLDLPVQVRAGLIRKRKDVQGICHARSLLAGPRGARHSHVRQKPNTYHSSSCSLYWQFSSVRSSCGTSDML